MSNTSHKLSVGEKIGYSLGDFSANLVFQTLMTYLAYFYTDIYKIPAEAATPIIFFVGIFAAVLFNPIMGMVADRTKTKWGNIDLGYCGPPFLLELFRSWHLVLQTLVSKVKSFKRPLLILYY